MPWKEVGAMRLRNEFAVRASQKHSNMSELCREYGISRSVGYKLLNRYREEGLSGIEPRSKRPKGSPLQISAEMVCEVIALRHRHPTWGARIIRELLCDDHDKTDVPCARTIDRILDRAGLVEKRRRSTGRWLDRDKLIKPTKPNQVWTVDFKGWWKTRDRKPCFPLTIRDAYSRYILEIGALDGTNYEGTKAVFESVFERYGLPDTILSDNGIPFASVLSVQGLTRLSAWWVKLGIRPRRIYPGCPFMNGSHERMHRDIKKELQRSPCWNLKDEQKRFNDWIQEYNNLRPNQGVGMKRPSKVYRHSEKKLPSKIEEFEYQDMDIRRVSKRGFISWHQKPCFISGALGGETLGIKHENKKEISIWFCELKLGASNNLFDYPLGGSRYQSLTGYGTNVKV